MFQKKTILSFIGARAGSKGLKNKNVRVFGGKPLLCWSVEASLKSAYVDRTVVSTDGKEIANIAKEVGADVPFLRPVELAQDQSSIFDSIIHGITWIREHENLSYDYILLLMPTSPLRSSEDIDHILEYYFQNRKTESDTLVCVDPLPETFGWAMAPSQNGYIDFCFKSAGGVANRQELPKLFLPSGLVYIAPTSVMLEKENFYTEKTIFYITDPQKTIDIDTEEEWQKAEKILAKRQKNDPSFRSAS